ncbi:MAG: hypothetical protein ACYTBX_19395 [Planctomycetota bacterium]|jgi:hypothetical protein
MAMWFYDEAGELEEYQSFKKEALRLEKEHYETRLALREAEAALKDDPENEDFKARVDTLKKNIEKLERQAPWLTFDYPVEVLLWGAPHG